MSAFPGFLLVAMVLTGCAWDDPPVEWQAPAPIATDVDTTARYGAVWAPGASPEVRVARADRPDSAASVALRSPIGACPGSWVEAPLVRGSRWSAWWQIRADSSAGLLAEQRDSSGATLQRIMVDSVDRALLGCARPAPAIAVDAVNGYVHISYYMVAPEGPGLFYSHLMDPRLRRFEPPVAVVYGEKPVRVAVASRADTVAVAYEDPNSDVGRIAMSVSLTSGHLFEQTARLIPVSTSSQHASAPQIVRLSEGQLWVGWTEASQSGSAYLLRRAQLVAR
ncbi:MAG: hypothetical protein U5K74_01310 [Gemmatimonadaceae bacterium]|nr:hypothetical protein [Gemmatimonadaceae bacterium]